MNKTEILNFIRNRRKEKNITQEEMAKSIGMKTNTYGDLEKGNTRIRLEDLLLICKKLDIDPVLLVKKTNQIILTLDPDQVEMFESLNDQIQHQIKLNNVNIKTDGGDIVFGNQYKPKK